MMDLYFAHAQKNIELRIRRQDAKNLEEKERGKKEEVSKSGLRNSLVAILSMTQFWKGQMGQRGQSPSPVAKLWF